MNPSLQARPRLIPYLAFPNTAYVPGKDMAHPKSIQNHTPNLTISEASHSWTEPYLYGYDLFNFGYFWEAHEAWESVWLKVSPPQKSILKALIKFAAMGVKIREGRLGSIELLTEGAQQLLTGFPHRQNALGAPFQSMREIAQQALEHSKKPLPPDAASKFVFEKTLIPR